MVYLLFYREDSVFGDTRVWIDKWCGSFGITPIIIDLDGGLKESLTGAPLIFHTLEAAQAHFQSEPMTWVYLDYNAEIYLDEYAHPENDVIYCVGHNIYGFGDTVVTGDIVKIRTPDEWFAEMIPPMLMYDRSIYLTGRRA